MQTHVSKFAAILWDCDGCLIDSEAIACGHAAEELTAAGYSISMQDYVLRFAGKSRSDIHSIIRIETGLDLDGLIDPEETLHKRNQLFREKLQPIDGIRETLDAISLPMAIASGSEFERLEYTLGITSLFDRFVPHVYSSEVVANGKPAPDIFLYAANRIGVAPAECLVIEDSENGVRAGKAAGMIVCGFLGGSHIINRQAHAQRLKLLGADMILEDIRELPALCQSYPASLSTQIA